MKVLTRKLWYTKALGSQDTTSTHCSPLPSSSSFLIQKKKISTKKNAESNRKTVITETLPIDGVMKNGGEIVGFRQVWIGRRNGEDSENEKNEDEESESDEKRENECVWRWWFSWWKTRVTWLRHCCWVFQIHEIWKNSTVGIELNICEKKRICNTVTTW